MGHAWQYGSKRPLPTVHGPQSFTPARRAKCSSVRQPEMGRCFGAHADLQRGGGSGDHGHAAACDEAAARRLDQLRRTLMPRTLCLERLPDLLRYRRSESRMHQRSAHRALQRPRGGNALADGLAAGRVALPIRSGPACEAAAIAVYRARRRQSREVRRAQRKPP